MSFRGTSPAPAMAPYDLLSFARDVSPIVAEQFPVAKFATPVARLLYGLYENMYVANCIEIVEHVITLFL